MTPDELSISCQKPKSLAQLERCANRAQSQLFSHFSLVITLQSGPFANRPDKLGKRWAGWAKPIFHTNEQICDKKSQKKKKKKKKNGCKCLLYLFIFYFKAFGAYFFFFFFSFFVFRFFCHILHPAFRPSTAVYMQFQLSTNFHLCH